MQHNDSRPSYLLMGLVEASELRELLDEVYPDALKPVTEFVRLWKPRFCNPGLLHAPTFPTK
jgi:hypothetical protein